MGSPTARTTRRMSGSTPRMYHELANWWPLLRSLRLGRRFDLLLIPDAIMHATTLDDLRATLETAAAHCSQEGQVAVLPDFVRETFVPGTDDGGEDSPDGRGL